MLHAKTNTVALLFLATLTLTPLQATAADENEMQFLDTMDRYLTISERYISLASEPTAAIYFAVEGISEIYEDRGEKAQAIPHLERLLKAHKGNLAAANIIRLKLRDLYRETGQAQKALDQLDAVMAQNRSVLIGASGSRSRNGG